MQRQSILNLLFNVWNFFFGFWNRKRIKTSHKFRPQKYTFAARLQIFGAAEQSVLNKIALVRKIGHDFTIITNQHLRTFTHTNNRNNYVVKKTSIYYFDTFIAFFPEGKILQHILSLRYPLSFHWIREYFCMNLTTQNVPQFHPLFEDRKHCFEIKQYVWSTMRAYQMLSLQQRSPKDYISKRMYSNEEIRRVAQKGQY